jgi:hypothetical protein
VSRNSLHQLRTAALLVSLLLLPAPLVLADSGRINPRPAQTFRGWGMSLAWEANDLYGGERQPAQIKDPKIQSDYMDLLYGDPATRLTLGFSMAPHSRHRKCEFETSKGIEIISADQHGKREQAKQRG